MKIAEAIEQEISKTETMLHRLRSQPKFYEHLEEIVKICVAALMGGSKLILCGNGGSAADAQHWAAELVGRFAFDRPALPALALTTDTSNITAIGNDYGYDYVFSRQVQAMAQEGDILIAISTSGKSKNIVEAARVARELGLTVIGFTGADPRDLGQYADYCVTIPAEDTAKIQEGHQVCGHILCNLIERIIFAELDQKHRKLRAVGA